MIQKIWFNILMPIGFGFTFIGFVAALYYMVSLFPIWMLPILPISALAWIFGTYIKFLLVENGYLEDSK